MKLCVVLPALNEEATVANVIQRIPKDIPRIDDVAIVVVNDGSEDRTQELAEEAGATVVTHPETRGVGAAFQAGVKEALQLNADFMVSMDADGQFDPQDIPKLLEPLLEGRAGFVTASRFKNKAFYPRMGRIRFWGNKGMSALVSLLARKKFHDVSCGFRAYSRDTLQQINLFGRFTYTQETILVLSEKHIGIEEVPLKVRGTRAHGKSRVASNLLHYAIKSSEIVFRSFRDYQPMLFFGMVALILLVAGAALAGFLLWWYLAYGAFTPHKWAGFTAAYLFGMSFLVLVTGMVADMLARIRINQERILYLLKQREEAPPPSDED